MSNRRQLTVAAGLALATLLSGCDDRLDGRRQPNPFADEVAGPDATAPRKAAVPTGSESSDTPAEVVYVDPDSAEADDWFDDGPASAQGFEPTPMDAGRGYNPSPDGAGDWGADESE